MPDTQLDPTENSSNRYLIIGGAPKSATTSLFRYLSDHPEVCAASRKETYFFAREFDRKKVCNVSDTLESFESYFSHCHGSSSLRIEATPYTLYSSSTQRMADMLPDARILFILRDPVERLLSDYRMASRRGHRAAGTFEEFVAWQFKASGGHPPSLVEIGCYIKFLRRFFGAFGRNQVLVVFFEELRNDPSETMSKLCNTLEIDPEFYADYEFYTSNQALEPRYGWLDPVYISLEPVMASFRAKLMSNPRLLDLFEKILRVGKSTYYALNSRASGNRESISQTIRADLSSYYWPYSQALSEELNRDLPWKSFQRPINRETT